MPLSADDINTRFSYHAPDTATRQLHEEWREHERWMAEHIDAIPGGDTREKSLALTKLEEQTFWVHAHIARNVTQTDILL